MDEFKIFISYAHKDDAYFRIFKEGIESHSSSIKNPKWKIWCDREIPSGTLWHEAIQNEVQHSDMAILLVSANFLSSDYIETNEFLEFLNRIEKNGFIFFPILLSDCDFTKWKNLAERQIFIPNGKDYNLREHPVISYSHLVEFYKGEAVPNPYRESFHKNCILAIEKAIHSNLKFRQVSNSATIPYIEALSNDNLLNVLRLFQKQLSNKVLTQDELADLIDTKVKLYNAIFYNFDNQTEMQYGKDVSFTMFDRIIAFDHIQKADADIIQNFRNNKSFSFRERSLIVSSLTLSVFNCFDVTKIHLLLDFLTDFEDEVWQKALVGVLFATIQFNNRLSLFPAILARLNELKNIPKVQNSIYIINKILKYKTYSSRATFKNNKTLLLNALKMFFGETISISSDEISELLHLLSEKSELLECKILNEIFDKDNIAMLESIVDTQDSIAMELSDFISYMNFDKYIDLYELNPFMVNMNNELFKTPHNWFYPFEDTEKIKNMLVNNFPLEDIDISDFLQVIHSSTICNIDKLHILFSINEFSDDFLRTLYFMLSVDIYLSNKNYSELELVYSKIIREIYRFSSLSILSRAKIVFNDKISLYDKSLLDKITDDITKQKIEINYLIDNNNYSEALKVLQNLPASQIDYELNSSFVTVYILLKQYNEAIPYISNLIEMAQGDHTKQANAYSFAATIYIGLKDIDQYMDYCKKETTAREVILDELLKSDALTEEINENGITLANCYFNLNVSSFNLKEDAIQCVYYSIKYLNVFLLIPDFNNKRYKETIAPHIKDLCTLFSHRSFTVIYDSLKDTLENEISPKLVNKIHQLITLFSKTDNIDFYTSSKHFNIAFSHTNTIFEEIFPYIENIYETEPDTDGRIFHFISKGIDNKITLAIKDVLLNKTEEVLLSLIRNSRGTITIELFLNNLLSDDDMSTDSFADNILLDVLNFQLWDYNKLAIWHALFNSFYIQEKYDRAGKALTIIENTLDLFKDKNREEQVLWIDVALNLYCNFPEKDVQFLYYTIKYLNTFFVDPDITVPNLQESILSHEQYFYIALNPNFFSYNYTLIESKIENEISPRLFNKLHEMNFIFLQINDLNLFKTSKYYSAALAHINIIFEEIIPYVKDINVTENETDIRIFHFVSNGVVNAVKLPANYILLQKTDLVLINLIRHIAGKFYIDSFLDNLLSEEKSTYTTSNDDLLSELLNWHILIPNEEEVNEDV
jgi:hypothetical protein